MEGGKQLQGNSQAPVSSTLEEVSNSKACHNDGAKEPFDYQKFKKAAKKQNETAGKEARPFDTPKEKKAAKPGVSLEEKWKDAICFKCDKQGHKQRKCPENEPTPKG